MIRSFLIPLSCFFITSTASAQNSPKYIFPQFVEQQLIIEGPIDSHIYDAIAFAGERLESVDVVVLNSLGGNHHWAMEIARKIRELGWNTQVKEGAFCASACVYLFGAGTERIAHSSVWFGIHGARMGAGYRVDFASRCLATGELVVSQECLQLEEDNYDLNYEATREAFATLEINGVSPDLWETYMAFDDVEDWFLNFNFIKKPDWVLPASDALEFHLVTRVAN